MIVLYLLWQTAGAGQRREKERGKTKVRSFELLCSINDFFRSKKVNYINTKEGK